MTLRRYAVILPVLIALLAAAIFIAASGQQGAQAADKTSAKTEQASPKKDSSSDSSDDTWGDSSDDAWGDSSDESDDETWGDESEDDIGEGGSAEGGAVLSVGATENVAAENRLRSVRVIRQDTGDDEEEWVRYCFRSDVQDLEDGTESSFAVIGPDPELGITATDVEMDEARDNCVLAGFDSDADVKSYTLAAVEGGVVENREGEKNIADSIKLDGGRSNSSRNRTTGPDLTGVRVSESLNRVEFHFDEELEDDSTADAASFGFYTERGESRTGSETVSVDGKIATIEFDEDDQVDEAQRGFVKADAVQDTAGSMNTTGSIGGKTDAPDLTNVSRSSADTQYDFKFDEDVNDDVEASDFVLYTDDGEEIQGESASTDGQKVHVTYEREIEDYDTDNIVLAAVIPGDGSSGEDMGSDDEDDSDEEITLGTEKIGSTSTRAGRTNGPDLVSVSTDANDRRMTLTFDERVDDEDDDYDASGVYIATEDDELEDADRILEIEGKKVYVQADENLLDSLVGVTLEPSTIMDPEGNGNPLGTVAHGSSDGDSTSSSLYGHKNTNVH